VRSEIFSELTYHAAYEPQRAIRTDRFKYVRRFDDDP
jgi:N-sulfoglucosamine sulfohydrolase